jgi:hypothetical protein
LGHFGPVGPKIKAPTKAGGAANIRKLYRPLGALQSRRAAKNQKILFVSRNQQTFNFNTSKTLFSQEIYVC